MQIKYIKSLIIIIICIFMLNGCDSIVTGTLNNPGQNIKNADSDRTITIAASFYPVYIMALNIAKDVPDVKVVDMTKPVTGCLHDYVITPDDLKNLEKAKFFVINGAGMESFLGKVSSQYPNLAVIDSSKGISVIKGEGDTGVNPHLWVSISNAIMQVKNIGEQLSRQDSKNSEKYLANTNSYVKKLEAERDKMHSVLDGIKNRDIITFHEAFPYFAKEFGLNIVGVIEREPGAEPSARDLAKTIDVINKFKVKALFAEPQYPFKAAQIIANETSSKVYTLDPAVSGPMDADAYLNIMDSNLEALKEALD